jgi:5-methylcytosine-specific restriction endonuclease McrA
MSWVYEDEHDGLPYAMFSEAYIGGLNGPLAAFSLRDEETVRAIRTRDPRILDLLAHLLRNAEEIDVCMWARDNIAWEHWRREDSPDELQKKINIVLGSDLSSDEAKRYAADNQAWLIEQRRRAIKKAAKQNHMTRRRTEFRGQRDRLMLALIERDGYECAQCGSIDNITIDHIIPLSKGGDDELDNLRLLCQACNSRKGDR